MKRISIRKRYTLFTLVLVATLILSSQMQALAAVGRQVFEAASTVTEFSPARLGASIPVLLKNIEPTPGNFTILAFADAKGYGIANVGAVNLDHNNHAGKLFFATKKSGGDMTQRMVIDEHGDVGVGTKDPLARLHAEDYDAQLLLRNRGNGGGFWRIGQSRDEWVIGGNKLAFIPNSDNTSKAAVVFHTNGNVGIGATNPQAKLDVNGTTRTNVLEITGGADLAEPFTVTDAEAVDPGTIVALDPANPGQLRVATNAYDALVAGVISGGGGINPGLIMSQDELIDGETHPVALTGRVYVKAVGPMEVGNLLTTSDVAGHAMAATDRDKAFGATLGKAMGTLAEGETGLVLVLVALQ